jgi:hypothetical protein
MTLSELFDRTAEPVCIAARRSPVNKHGAFHKWDHLHSEYGAKGVSADGGDLAHLAKRSSHIPFSCREYSRFSNTSVAILMELLDSPADPVCMAAGYSPGKTKPQCSEAGARWIYFGVRGISTSVIFVSLYITPCCKVVIEKLIVTRDFRVSHLW